MRKTILTIILLFSLGVLFSQTNPLTGKIFYKKYPIKKPNKYEKSCPYNGIDLIYFTDSIFYYFSFDRGEPGPGHLGLSDFYNPDICKMVRAIMTDSIIKDERKLSAHKYDYDFNNYSNAYYIRLMPDSASAKTKTLSYDYFISGTNLFHIYTETIKSGENGKNDKIMHSPANKFYWAFVLDKMAIMKKKK
jgi:hypothetical protein